MSELSKEEIEDILVVVGRLYVRLNNLKDRYATPRKMLDKSLIKVMQKKKLSSVFLLFQISQGKLDQERLYSPKELNKRIAENLIRESNTATDDTISLFDQHQHEKFISSKEFRELLRLFENLKLLNHISGKQTIKKFKNVTPETAGRPEFYKLSDNVTRLGNLLSKPGIIDMIIKTLEKSGLLSNFLKKVFMSSILMFRDWNEDDIHILLKSINSQEVPDLETFTKSMRPKKEILLSADYDKIELVSQPIIDQMVSEIITTDNFMIRTILLLSLSEL